MRKTRQYKKQVTIIKIVFTSIEEKFSTIMSFKILMFQWKIRSEMGSHLSQLVKAKKIKMLVVGPDSAGKTTLLYRLKTGRNINTIPTIGFNTEEIQVGIELYSCTVFLSNQIFVIL